MDAPGQPPAVSVVIPSYRSRGTIRACLDSLLSQNFPLPYEIIVADSSDDDTPALVRRAFPQVELIHLNERTDPALARNTGARRARAALLAFIDSDCTAAPGWLNGLWSGLEAGYEGVGGSIVNANPASLVSWAGYFSEFREFLPDSPRREVRNLTLGNAAYTAAAFWQAGGFPPGCFPQEDQVFHHRFRACGFRLLFDPLLRVYHTHRTESRDYLEHQRRIGQANARVVRQLGLPGQALVERPALARLGLPGLAALRWLRTMWACRRLENGLVWKRPPLAGLLALGMVSWGRGFAEEAGRARPRA